MTFVELRILDQEKLHHILGSMHKLVEVSCYVDDFLTVFVQKWEDSVNR